MECEYSNIRIFVDILTKIIDSNCAFRYGRITVSTLETKLAGSEKDVTRFTKALERSDKYIKELESELKSYRDGKGGTVNDRAGKPLGIRGDKYLPNGDLVLKYQPLILKCCLLLIIEKGLTILEGSYFQRIRGCPSLIQVRVLSTII